MRKKVVTKNEIDQEREGGKIDVDKNTPRLFIWFAG